MPSSVRNRNRYYIAPEPDLIATWVFDRPWRIQGRCPRCHGTLRHRAGLIYCDCCNDVTPGLARLIHERPSARETHVERERVEAARLAAERALENRHRGELSEQERRDIWLGRTSAFGGDFKQSRADTAHFVSNLQSVGRAWLEQIGQSPDFSIVLDRRGREVGRLEETSTR